LESWGDAEPVRGRLSLQQPTMDPVFDSRATADVLLALARGDQQMASRFRWPDYRSYLASRIGGDMALKAALPTALMNGSAASRGAGPRFDARPAPVQAQQGEYDLIAYVSPTLGDGRGANK